MVQNALGTVVFNTSPIERPSFRDYIAGAKMAFWLSGNTRSHFHFATSAYEADCAALTNDWGAVRQDFLDALDSVVDSETRAHDADDRCCL